jgi:NAD(P)-dependent dehydrogenase (short-subunit alcohol dehydrogenase family)
MTRLANKVAIITGAASGIGLAGAIRFAREGAQLVIGDLDYEALESVAKHIEADGGRTVALRCDVASPTDNEALVALALKEFGRVDILWANAGYMPGTAPISELTLEIFQRTLAVNTVGPWLGVKAALSSLQQGLGANVLFTASLSGLKGRPDMSTYQASKGAVVMMTRSLAKELAPFHIRVNSICPGPTDTSMMRTTLSEFEQQQADAFISAVPLGRMGRADELANAALFLCSDEASFITGVNLNVDGGLLA